MGSISRFALNKISKDYNAIYFVETGTWKGDGVAVALQNPFQKIISIEIIPQIAALAKKRFQLSENVKIIAGASTPVLLRELPTLKGNCIFWLDAHFPGAEEGIMEYNAEKDESLRLPLENEIEVISMARTCYKDVLIIDDFRIYEDGPFENGNAPEDVLPKGNRGIGFIYDHFGSTHKILKSYREEGYLFMRPVAFHG